MKPLDSNPRPINLNASRLLWKSPWWAKAPPEEKKQLVQQVVKVGYDAFIDYLKPPPVRPGGELNQVKDLRGMEIVWTKGTLRTARILGYADHKIKIEANRAKRGGADARERRVLYWWAFTNDGFMVRIRAGQGKTCYKFKDQPLP